MARLPKANELSSREDFIIQSFSSMKKVNTMANKLFDLYFIDVDRNSELTPMMRTMVPTYYIDPTNPEHPGCYILAGKSSVSYLERIVYIQPYINEKGKYEYDLSAWRGLLINPVEFADKSKAFRKSKLEPLVIMGERNGERYNQSLILREDTSKAKEELVVPFLQVPNRKRDGEDAFQNALQTMVYDPFYQYLPRYLYRGIPFTHVPQETIQELIDMDLTEFITEEHDRISVTKSLFPTIKADNRFSIGRVPNPDINTSGGRYHYVVMQEILNEHGSPYITIYTLLAALQLQNPEDYDG